MHKDGSNQPHVQNLPGKMYEIIVNLPKKSRDISLFTSLIRLQISFQQGEKVNKIVQSINVK